MRSFYWSNLYATPNVTICDFKETLSATFKEVCVPHVGDGVGEQGRTSDPNQLKCSRVEVP
jgi:hypothetical protein